MAQHTRFFAFIGIFWSFGFIIPEAIQAVFFGSTFQKFDSFFIGGVVFAITTILALVWVYFREAGQLLIARNNARDLIGANITNALAWVLYFLAIQRIEPVIAFTIFSGMIQLTTLYLGTPSTNRQLSGRPNLKNPGNVLLLLGMVWLAIVTVGGWSGFVRGGTGSSVIGVLLAVSAGAIFSGMLLYCNKLDRAGLRPIPQIGLRFPAYILICLAGVWLGLDTKQPVPVADTIIVISIALPLMAFPIFALQKAINTASSLTIGAVSATGPLLVFLLQVIEGRVAYSPLTLGGLLIYFAGAVLVLVGYIKSTQERCVG